MKREQGIGLVEVLISLFLSSVMISALTQQYISMKHHYAQFQSSLEETMDQQLVTDVMRDSIRQAGFTPCLSITHLSTLDSRRQGDHLTAVERRANDTSVLRINRMDPAFESVLAVNSSLQILATHHHSLHKTHPVIIADCYHAEVHTIRDLRSTSEGQLISLTKPLTFSYHPPVYVGEWFEERFFVRPNGGLFLHRQRTDELASSVKSMRTGFSTTAQGLMIEVNLGLKNAHHIRIDTRVRA
jgi:hypothetical protein